VDTSLPASRSFAPLTATCPTPDPALFAALTWLVGREAATKVLRTTGAVGVTQMRAIELAATAGLELPVAERIVAARYLGTLFIQEARRPLVTPLAAARALPAELFTSETEHLYGLALDGRHGLKACVLLGKGGTAGVGLQVRDVLTPLLRLGAVSFILAHNHPSGDPTPSKEDVVMTSRVAAGAELIGLSLLDHLVVAGGKITSLYELGLLPGDQELTDLVMNPPLAPSP